MSMEMSTPTATSTPTSAISYTYTTYTNSSPTPFRKPTIIPSSFPFGGAPGCSSLPSLPTDTPLPSNYPVDRPSAAKPGCVISNDADVNDHAFWDLYECCTWGDMGVLGMPLPCTAVCVIESGDEQTLRRLGECLSKRVGVVVCSDRERMNETESSSSSSSVGETSTSMAASGTASLSASLSGGATASAATGGAGKGVGVQRGDVSRAGVMVFGILALASAVGMLL
ncbi:hypothetical protein L13192_11627 [Pyrenophora tritici-repentis]|uniref:Uncharacterized protein n=1 Tax=Pyrenophora tritici-repentis TaxID=45151 RepID=A0A922SSD3_9PLEO|nr:hypothetical protein Ptr86124_005562 [Pyrenophora tritici-repentis]KAI1664443.1 hypothetical protein L13192_11627 [Pyrenophora tritici-repentis]KAI1678549.1 hypothetical protein KJE20_12157 [Pyrenophora tritici-repentis]